MGESEQSLLFMLLRYLGWDKGVRLLGVELAQRLMFCVVAMSDEWWW